MRCLRASFRPNAATLLHGKQEALKGMLFCLSVLPLTQYSHDRMRPDKGSPSVLRDHQADKFPAPTLPFKKQNIYLSIYVFIYLLGGWEWVGTCHRVCVEIRGRLEGLNSTLPPRGF